MGGDAAPNALAVTVGHEACPLIHEWKLDKTELATVVPMRTLEEPGSTRDALITGTVPAPVMSSPSLVRRAQRPMISVVTRSSIQHSRCRTFYRTASA
jgi:hypothetical protein